MGWIDDIRKIVIDVMDRTKGPEGTRRLIRWVLFLSTLVLLFVPTSYSLRLWLDPSSRTRSAEFWILAAVFVAALMALIVALCALRRLGGEVKPLGGELVVVDDQQPQALGKPFPVRMDKKPGARPREVQVRHLGPAEPALGRSPIQITWPVFIDGVQSLEQQIDKYSPEIQPDLCVGINAPGLVMATVLAEHLRHGRRAVGFVPVDARHGVRKDDVSLPRLRGIKSVLLVDREVKIGTSIGNVIQHLRDTYKDSDLSVKIAVLVAGDVKGAITHIQDLCVGHNGVFAEDEVYLPDFLAFTAAGNTRVDWETWPRHA